MQRKSFEIIETKADGAGTFEALVSVFGNVDSVGDRILPGAYAKTLDQWRESGDPLPIILSHQWDDAMAHVGVANPHDVVETDRGLFVKGQLDVEDNPVARQVHKLLKRRSLKEFSIGYTVPKGGEKRGKDGANDISEINLVEVGPTLKGANSATELHAVKSALEQDGTGLLGEVRETLKRQTATAEQMLAVFSDAPELAHLVDLKAVWTAAYINDLPDSAFLYVEPGGEKDGEDKTTPRSLRHFPYKDAGGNVDLPHLRNALARIPQSNLPQEVKDRLTQRAQSILDSQKSAEVTDKEPKARSVDPLRQRSDEAVLDIQSDGHSSRKPPKKEAKPPPPEPRSHKELRRESRDLMLELLSE